MRIVDERTMTLPVMRRNWLRGAMSYRNPKEFDNPLNTYETSDGPEPKNSSYTEEDSTEI